MRAALGFAALATTSSSFAATLGELDGQVGRDAAVAHAAEPAAAVPVSADLENGFADDPAGSPPSRARVAVISVGTDGPRR